MGVYGRRFNFLVPPRPEQRYGMCVVGDSPIVIGAPVVLGTTEDANGQREMSLVTGATAPLKGKHGIIVYENPFDTAPGFDPIQYAFGDFDLAPAGAPAQLVSGDQIRVRFSNVAEQVIQGQKTYPAATMIGGFGATPTLAIDDLVGPGVGNDTDGYWQEADSSHAWFRVTGLDHAAGEVSLRMLF